MENNHLEGGAACPPTIKTDTFRLTLAASLAAQASESIGNMSLADAARLLGIEPKEYNCATHGDRLLAKLSLQMADAFIAEAGR